MKSAKAKFWTLLPVIALACAAAGCRGRTAVIRALVPQGLALSMTQIARSFEAENPGAKVEMLFASSGTLAQQAKAGMPADVFFSASDKTMDDVCRTGIADEGTRIAVARNSLVLVAPSRSGNRFGGPSDLLFARAERIAMGNPGHVPSGVYAMQALASLGIADELKPKILHCEHVRQVLALVSRGEADAGFVYATDAASDPSGLEVVWTAPPDAHEPIVFSMALLSGCANRDLAGRFASFVAGPQGRAILVRHGFMPPDG